ncbi:GNAT family N-acetyltransferase [Cohnella zeiphila]|uniref:GNAT family N-acetyltransferase n=1 Tax=Cohnella zeiphila TaxID=2761120 RepID=A0A7X0SSJ8_9BACL|nr:GNAT family N-acetyltransferase [Cohnella zeiphila]MBB6735191.1 GNAT family N-acetyltransferase [Cohnella zeiphila]
MLLPSYELTERIERAETEALLDRMEAIRSRPGNPEAVEVARIGGAVCFYSRTMPWPSFNTVKGVRSADVARLDEILDFYRSRGRKPQFELVPALAGPELAEALADRGFYASGSHASLFADPGEAPAGERPPSGSIEIRRLREDEFETYGTIHCRSFGLPDNGIAPVAENNRVLHGRPGWSFYLGLTGDRPAAAAVLRAADGVGSLTFAATLPEYRGLGLHRELLLARLEETRRLGGRLLVGQCAYLSRSHRNMERIGMRLAYVRSTWTERRQPPST